MSEIAPKSLAVYRIGIVAGALGYLFNWYMPESLWRDQSYSELLRFDGYGARLVFVSSVHDYLLPAANTIALMGMFYFRNWGRVLFLATCLVSVALDLVLGLRVVPPLSKFLDSLVSMIDGLLVYAACFSPLASSFRRTKLGRKGVR